MPKEELSRWVKAFITGVIIFFLFSLYLYARRGYYDLYIINKVFGSTAAVLAGLTLLAGPLSRLCRCFAPLTTIRKQLGLLGLFLALFHAVASTLFLPDKFPLTWYQNEWLPVLFGLLAIGIWLYIGSISNPQKIHQMTFDIWKKRQQTGAHIAFWAIYLHLVIMKYKGWIKWLNGQVKVSPDLANPTYPPASTFVFLIMTGVILYRLLLFALGKIKK